ncbi:phage capsid protein [Tistrella mobilis]|uniref:phage capsid protein n=1 Tax=Tistrella mobilis TaxID=171437 RepID=UPI0035573356
MAGEPFPISPVLTGISLAYANGAYIADNVMPRLPPHDKSVYLYHQFGFDQLITVPDTTVGRKSAPTEVEFRAEERTSQTKRYGLDDPVPLTDSRDAPDGYDPVDFAVTGLTELILLDREVRVASIVQSASSYAASQVETLTGSDKWSDPTSDPLGQIADALDVPPLRPNVMTLGARDWSVLRRHPALVSAINRSSGDKGRVTRREAADLIEVDRIEVGAAWVNAARPGQPSQRVRVWGGHASLTYQAPNIGSKRIVTWGWTAQTKAPGSASARFAGSKLDDGIGMYGGTRVRVGEEVEERVVAPDLGYLFREIL